MMRSGYCLWTLHGNVRHLNRICRIAYFGVTVELVVKHSEPQRESPVVEERLPEEALRSKSHGRVPVVGIHQGASAATVFAAMR